MEHYFIIFICIEREKLAYLHFSHYTSLETLSCHSDESAQAMAMQNIIFVKANIIINKLH